MASSEQQTAEYLTGRFALVAGGTGNVGRHIVAALLQRGATVVVPSRSAEKADSLRAALRSAVGPAEERLITLTGDVADEHDAARIRDEAARRLPTGLDAVVASLGRWKSAPSLLRATRSDLVTVLNDYVVAHFVVARTFIPELAPRGGSYLLINGPSAFTTFPGSALVSIATAAQAMLARALAEETAAGGSVAVTDLVIHPSAMIGPELTRDGGPIDGAAVGRYVAGIIAGRAGGGGTVHLESAAQLSAIA
ncbi:MAG TPA: SDR family NAD(P)-dependent oxidoreductase [Gemmatimonadaceae bacterium]|jgi:NAD(P)-dependent dehydrogenase (short-subunit alcohol dehydrogenase family)|nr:SDR family NAD(P)-dependent oxidoreductase [Gemmatimonadaceae bacterium]